MEINPNLGWGKPGGKKWNLSLVSSYDTSTQIKTHIKQLTGKNLNTNLPFQVVKKTALMMVEEYFNDCKCK